MPIAPSASFHQSITPHTSMRISRRGQAPFDIFVEHGGLPLVAPYVSLLRYMTLAQGYGRPPNVCSPREVQELRRRWWW